MVFWPSRSHSHIVEISAGTNLCRSYLRVTLHLVSVFGFIFNI